MKRKPVIPFSILVTLFLCGSLVETPTKVDGISQPFFTLIAMTNSDGERPDILNLIKQQLARIGIDLQVQIMEWPALINQILSIYEYDLCYIGFAGGGSDPDFTGVYNENGSLNLFGYDITMDYDEELGTGINEWYMREGTQIMPPNSLERIEHYHAWEQYLMDDILPCQPTFIPKNYLALWSNLRGYNLSDGLLQSWGKMSWDGIHAKQDDPAQVVIADSSWISLNPSMQSYESETFINSLICDSLIKYDSELATHPHLATSWTLLNDTHLRINIRQGIKWQPDHENLFTDEYLDADDVYFSYFSEKNFGTIKHEYTWLEKITKVDQYTVDLFIDENPDTHENEPFAPYTMYLTAPIHPEHYLNQTQELDGTTPDISHPAWSMYGSNCFGTGLFYIDSIYEGVETNLKCFEDCWLLNESLDKTGMNFESRFGDFSGGLTKLKIRNLPDKFTAVLEFEVGRVDLIDVNPFPNKRLLFSSDSDYALQEQVTFWFNFIGYNLRESRTYLGSRELAPGDSSLTVGLALRKAVSYAIDRHEINNIVYNGDYLVTDYPIYERMGIWCNPTIIRYNHNLDKAKELMHIAGFDINWTPTSPGFELTIVLASLLITANVSTVIIKRKSK